MFFSAMYFSIIVDDGVGLLIADAGFLVDNGRSVFYADAVGYFASDPWIIYPATSYYILRFEMVVSAVLWFLNLQKTPICFINTNHFYSNNKVV